MFIVIEGSDGSGKATQLELIAKHPQLRGQTITTMDFPQYGQKSAGLAEEYLNGKYGGVREVSPYIASLFFAVDRFDASFKIRAAVSAGKIVISNRYTLSSAAHQGAKIKNSDERQKFFHWLNELEYDTLKLPRPDLTIFLHVPAEIGYELILKKQRRDYLGGKARDIHEADLEYLKTVEQAYLTLSENDPAIQRIECAPGGILLPIEQINDLILQEILRRL
ncbi:dTMP kinase [Candidatus Uhrbacteria bacterium]|nr:dTMP kinase [Candidatus Uhrbacteria bacterium]